MSESPLRTTSDIEEVGKSNTDFIIFYSSVDASSNKLWCPDCRDVESLVENVFGESGAPSALIVYVGQRNEWKDEKNPFRAPPWKVKSIPTIVRRHDDARLVESAITDKALKDFISGT